ncbi:MAG: ACP S-malonyltransferase [Chloroflexi bacterium]|nr:ACP S-malonyltransferase [Chloroflexota bacterium]
MKSVFMFPGQSSLYPAMVERILNAAPSVSKPLVDLASETLGRDLVCHYRSVNANIFATNRDVQIGVFLTNHLHLAVLEAAGIGAELSLGLSLGEYNHLVHIGALDFREALRLVEARGHAYDGGPEGAMASVFPIELDDILDVVQRARQHGTLDLANLNSPSQVVISGERAALDAALRILEEEHYYVEAVVIESRIPMHSRRFRPVQAMFRPVLEMAPWRSARLPYVPNVLGLAVESPVATDYVELLSRHVCEPVRWRDSIDYVVQAQPDAALVEVGPRAVLYNLLQRRWHPVAKFKTDSEAGVAVKTVACELNHAG